MKHRFNRILPLLSLLAAVGMIAFWFISFHIEEGIAWTDWKKVVVISAYRGNFCVSQYSNVDPADLWMPAGFIVSSKALKRVRDATISAQTNKMIEIMTGTVSTIQVMPDGSADARQQKIYMNSLGNGLPPPPPPVFPKTWVSKPLSWQVADFSVPLWPFVLILFAARAMADSANQGTKTQSRRPVPAMRL